MNVLLSKTLKIFLFLTFFWMPYRLMAEGGCPPGQVPKQFGQIIGCAPGFIVGPEPPPQPSEMQVIQKDSWGAIAGDGVSVLGISKDHKNKKAAEKNAVKDCKNQKGVGCKAIFVFSNQCVSIVSSSSGSSIGTGLTEDLAIEDGMNRCKEKGGECRVYRSFCSYPEDVG